MLDCVETGQAILCSGACKNRRDVPPNVVDVAGSPADLIACMRVNSMARRIGFATRTYRKLRSHSYVHVPTFATELANSKIARHPYMPSVVPGGRRGVAAAHLEEDCGQGGRVLHIATAVETHHVVGEVGVESHAWGNADGQISVPQQKLLR